MKKLRNIQTLIAILAVIFLVGIGFNACGQNDLNEADQSANVDQGVPLPQNDAAATTDGGGNVLMNEIDEIPGTPEVGDIFHDTTNPITGARAYEEMQITTNQYEPEALRSRVIVEYKGKKVEMRPSTGILQFSPDGKYLLYLQSEPTSRNEGGTYLYSIESGKTQELIPSVPETDPAYKPFPDTRYMKWEKGKITYDRFGKSWTLTYKEE